MQRRLRSVLISHKMTPLYGLNICGYGTDAEAVRCEIAALEETLAALHHNVHLVAMDFVDTEMTGEMAVVVGGFLRAHPGGPVDPIRKLAVLGAPRMKRIWWKYKWKITWPRTAQFFDAQEDAKAWLIHEG